MRSVVVTLLCLSLLACKSGIEPAAPTPSQASAPPSGEGSGSAAQPAEGSAVGSPESGSAPEGSELVEAVPPPDPMELVRQQAQGHGPIDGTLHQMIWGVQEDDVPEVLNATREDLENRHYLTCDELNLHLWYEHVKDIGGAYAGVGSDQAYTFIGWMRPNVAWLTDYDPWVRTVHKIYRLAFERSETIDEFFAFWDPDNDRASWALIEERWSDDLDFRLMPSVWRDWSGRIYYRLRRYNRTLNEAEIPWFLNDAETYTFVRDFAMSGRVRPLLANLLDDTALHQIGEVSRQIDVPIRVFYLSNAEDYWRYPDQFRQNFQDLYFDERSLILRTNAAKPSNGDYRYCTQAALNFQRWLQQDYVRSVRDIWQRPAVRDENHIPMTIIGLDEEPVDR